MALALEDVRRVARAAGLRETYFNQASRIVSFAPEVQGADVVLTRINVYWTTGTVATCVDHPRQGPTQLFRRNVSLVLLRQLMLDPRLHTGVGYHHRRDNEQRVAAVPLDEEAAANAEMAVLGAELEELKTRMEAVMAVKQACQGRRKAAERRAEEEKPEVVFASVRRRARAGKAGGRRGR